MNIDYSKIETVNKFAIKYAEQNPLSNSTVLFLNNWHADYSIKVKKYVKYNHSNNSSRDYNLKTTIDCSLNIRNMYNFVSTDISSRNIDFCIGDIVNEYLNIFTPINSDGLLDFNININLLNNFIKKYCYPPVSYEVDSKEINEKENIGINKDGMQIINSSVGFKKNIVKINPFEHQIKDYVNALKDLYYKIFCINYGKGLLNFKVTYYHQYSCTNGEFVQDKLIHQESIDSIILYDVSNSIERYKFMKCPICNKYFFQNNKQKYCISCKQLSKMTKSEIEEKQIKSNILSNNYERLAYLRKLNRVEPKLTDKEKNKLLKERGFKPLQK